MAWTTREKGGRRVAVFVGRPVQRPLLSSKKVRQRLNSTRLTSGLPVSRSARIELGFSLKMRPRCGHQFVRGQYILFVRVARALFGVEELCELPSCQEGNQQIDAETVDGSA